jgi:hypothetical protein
MRPNTPVGIVATVRYMESIMHRYWSGSGADEYVRDSLANLRHYCDAHSLAFAELDRQAYQHYCQELHELPSRPARTPQPTDVYLQVPLQNWTDRSEAQDHSLLIAPVYIQKVAHFLSAIRVRMDDGRQVGWTAEGETVLAELHAAAAGSGAFQVIRVLGADYVLCLVPST